jgi:hypothetical protein
VIGKDDLGPLVEKEAATNSLSLVAGVFLAIAVFLSISSIIDIARVLNDNTIPLVTCPRAFELDAPVLMKTVALSDKDIKDKWIKGFMRRVMQSQFPRSVSDAERSLKYVVNHSEGRVHKRYLGFLNDLEPFKVLLQGHFFYAFYPTNSLSIRIRGTGTSGEWAVEVDGFMIRYVGNKEERTTPTLRYVIKAGDHTMENPEGLYVIDSNILEYADYVSGRKENK